jgi:hypothetical protein
MGDPELDYASLARLLDQAAREHHDLARSSNDPLERLPGPNEH